MLANLFLQVTTAEHLQAADSFKSAISSGLCSGWIMGLTCICMEIIKIHIALKLVLGLINLLDNS